MTELDRPGLQNYFGAVRYAVSALPAALIGAICVFAPAASAGEYTVYSCRADESSRNSSWSPSANSSHVTAYSDGCGSGGGGLVARSGVEPPGSIASAFDSATWRFDAPAGASVSQVALSGRAYRASGGRWGVGLSDQGGTYQLGGISSDAMAWESNGWATIATPGSTTLYFGVICASGTGCPTTSTGQPTWGYARARADLYGARVRVTDTGAPSVGSVRGSLVSGTWTGGVASVGFDASDSVGVARQAFSVSGAGREELKSCDFTRPAPCPTQTGSDFGVDTRTIPDGERTLTLTATDTAGNPASWTGTVYIDNNTPGAPSQPQLQGADPSRWRSANGFTLAYENPSRAGGAPLTSHDIQVCPTSPDGTVDPTSCTFANRPGAPGTDSVNLPAPGRYRFRVRVDDALYSGAWSPWSDVLRFDDVSPATPSVAFPAGWINADSAKGSLSMSPPASSPIPVSGISGYRVTGASAEGVTWVGASSAGVGLLPYFSLDEGRTELSVVAVSGSGVETPASRPALGTVRKDTGSPTLTVTGVPTLGATVPYVVTLSATGSDSVSGMDGAPPDRPAADGGFVAFRSPGGAPTVFRGAEGRLSPGEGGQSVTITATDVAGNASVPAQAIYTQDTRVPTGGLLLPEPGAASAIRFLVSESCAGETSIEISTAPGEWTPLPTGLSDGIATAKVPGTIWDNEVPYTLRALVTDCAGNQATLSRWAAGPSNGQPIGQLQPPKRARTTIRATVSAPSRSSKASTARTRVVRAQVRGANGEPVGGAKVTFETQPRAAGAQWQIIASEMTSRSGAASRSIPNTCSQRIRVTISGDDVFAPSTSNVAQTTVHASSSITARPTKLRNGRRLTLSGKLSGGHVPGGLELTLYGKGPRGRSWVPVRSPVTVSRSGRWKTTYRFTSTRTRTAYRFRVRIPSRPDYPFASGYSRSRTVTVAP